MDHSERAIWPPEIRLAWAESRVRHGGVRGLRGIPALYRRSHRPHDIERWFKERQPRPALGTTCGGRRADRGTGAHIRPAAASLGEPPVPGHVHPGRWGHHQLADRPSPAGVAPAGSGARVLDADGNEYVDLHGGYGVNLLGHGHPNVVQAVRSRIAEGSHFSQPTEDALVVLEDILEPSP